MNKPCTIQKIIFNTFYPYHISFSSARQEKSAAAFAAAEKSLLTERLAVSALIHSRICLVGAYQNAVQGAEVLGIAVVSAGLDGALDALIGIGIHYRSLLIF